MTWVRSLNRKYLGRFLLLNLNYASILLFKKNWSAVKIFSGKSSVRYSGPRTELQWRCTHVKNSWKRMGGKSVRLQKTRLPYWRCEFFIWFILLCDSCFIFNFTENDFTENIFLWRRRNSSVLFKKAEKWTSFCWVIICSHFLKPLLSEIFLQLLFDDLTFW